MDSISKCILAGVVALGIGALWVSQADAQGQPPMCGPSAELVSKLKRDYNEVEVGGGLVNDKAVIVAFASPDGETWTLLAMGADGMSCLISSGEHWFLGPLPKKGDPA